MIQSVEHHITNHCNLNCAGCSHFSPLCKPWNETFDEFKKEWDRVCAKGLKIARIRILGGEPLLNPDLGQMIEYVRGLFPSSNINVVTNAILLKKRKEELLPIFLKNNISLTVSIYPELKLNYGDLLRGFPITEVYDKAGFWNMSLHTERAFDKNLAYYNCFSGAIAKCRFLKDGRFYPCCMIPNLPHLINYFPELKDTELGQLKVEDYGISIENHSVEEIEQFLKNPNPVCSFCNSARAREINPWKQSTYNINEWME